MSLAAPMTRDLERKILDLYVAGHTVGEAATMTGVPWRQAERVLTDHGHPDAAKVRSSLAAMDAQFEADAVKDGPTRALEQVRVSELHPDPDNPRDLGYFERGPLSPTNLGGTWSAYYYNGHVYSSDIQKGFDVLRITDASLKKAADVKMDTLNVQSQPVYRK